MATPTKLSFTYRDDDGVKASSIVYVSYNGAAETVDGLIGVWQALGALLDLVSGAVIESGAITIPLAGAPVVAGWKTDPLTGHSVNDTLNLVMGNASDIYTDTVIVPALRDSLVTDGKPEVASGDPIDDLAQEIIGSFTNGYYVNQDGRDLTTWVKAFQGSRSHRRQLTARSTARPA